MLTEKAPKYVVGDLRGRDENGGVGQRRQNIYLNTFLPPRVHFPDGESGEWVIFGDEVRSCGPTKGLMGRASPRLH